VQQRVVFADRVHARIPLSDGDKVGNKMAHQRPLLLRRPLLSVIFCVFVAWNTAVCQTLTDVRPITEELVFESGHFRLVGDLIKASATNRHSVVILVHGDGPIDRNAGGFYLPIIERFLRAGYVVFAWDKPGTGESVGEFDPAHLFSERAGILVDAINVLKKHPSVISDRIGVWGISQAGYVIARAVTMTDEISFMILVGTPGMDSIDQTAYLVRKQVLAEGCSQKEAARIERNYQQAERASTYETYCESHRMLQQAPVLAELGVLDEAIPEEEWRPNPPDGQSFFTPTKVFERVTVPVLIFFGDKDTQADPFQGRSAYMAALRKAGNRHFRVELIAGADHFGILCEDGSLKAQRRRSRSEWARFAPQYLNLVESWLKKLPMSSPQNE
jgi:pimeloyl-ACP methyl ester carboxylesterase